MAADLEKLARELAANGHHDIVASLAFPIAELRRRGIIHITDLGESNSSTPEEEFFESTRSIITALQIIGSKYPSYEGFSLQILADEFNKLCGKDLPNNLPLPYLELPIAHSHMSRRSSQSLNLKLYPSDINESVKLLPEHVKAFYGRITGTIMSNFADNFKTVGEFRTLTKQIIGLNDRIGLGLSNALYASFRNK